MNKAGFAIIIQLLMVFMATIFLVALIPGLADIIDTGLASSGLNCSGAADYNSTAGERSSLGCLGLKLFIPFLVLGTLVVLINKLFYGDREMAPPSQPY